MMVPLGYLEKVLFICRDKQKRWLWKLQYLTTFKCIYCRCFLFTYFNRNGWIEGSLGTILCRKGATRSGCFVEWRNLRGRSYRRYFAGTSAYSIPPMKSIVLDTNCLIASLPSRSLYHQAWSDFVEGKYILCVSNEILTEYEEILTQKTNPFLQTMW